MCGEGGGGIHLIYLRCDVCVCGLKGRFFKGFKVPLRVYISIFSGNINLFFMQYKTICKNETNRKIV